MTVVGFIIGLALLSWAALPFFKKDTTWISLHMENEDLADRKQRVYGNIADLEFDHAMGRLSEKDFTSIRQAFLREAGRVVEQLEQQKSSDLSERIENDLHHLNKGKKAKPGKSQKFCTHCGHPIQKTAKFCGSCGKELQG